MKLNAKAVATAELKVKIAELDDKIDDLQAKRSKLPATGARVRYARLTAQITKARADRLELKKKAYPGRYSGKKKK